MGNICNFREGKVECGKFVQDLSIHLKRQHGLENSDETYISVMKNSKGVLKQSYLADNDNIVTNPSFDYKASKSCTLNKNNVAFAFNTKPYESPQSMVNQVQDSLTSKSNDHPKDVYEFESDFTSEDYSNLRISIRETISCPFQESILEFKKFLSTILGGSKSKKSRKGFREYF